MSKTSVDTTLEAVFGVDTQYMPNLSVKDRERAVVAVAAASDKLLARTSRLLELYPRLGWRPVKASVYVHQKGVWINDLLTGSNGDGTFAEVSHEDGKGYLIRETSAGVYVCSCADYQYNLSAMEIQDGSFQQPCCHILAVALSCDEIYRRFADV